LFKTQEINTLPLFKAIFNCLSIQRLEVIYDLHGNFRNYTVTDA